MKTKVVVDPLMISRVLWICKINGSSSVVGFWSMNGDFCMIMITSFNVNITTWKGVKDVLRMTLG